jgi:asparagine synthase (glutamine-hydrolysing)
LTPHATPGAIESFLGEGWLYPNPDGSTHLAAIREVRPGHCVEFDLDSWTLTETPCCLLARPKGTCPDGNLADIVADAVGARLVSDRKVGLLLSGGVDSSLILSVLAKKGWLDQVVCVTGEAGKSDDARYARLCLDVVGRKALELPMDYGGAGFDQFLAVCRAQEKPFPLIGNVLGMWALYAALGQEGVRVALDGTGADEIFGGYWKRYAGFALRDAARAGDTDWLQRVRASGAVPAALLELSDTQLAHGDGVTPEKDALRAREQDFLRGTLAHAIDAARISDPLIGFPGTLNDALFLDASAGRMQEWLWQNDRNAMAASIENRSPFLDWRLARFMAAPYSQKFDGAFNKRALRALFDVFTPLPTATRTDKQGFRWVFGRFMRQNRPQILELIRASHLAARYVDCGRLLPLAAQDDALLESRLMQRLMVIAGLEAVGKLAA